MRPLSSSRTFRVLLLVPAVVFSSWLSAARGADPVEDLKSFLFDRQQLSGRDEVTAFQKNLHERLKAIQSPGDLRRALLLEDWQRILVEMRNVTPEEVPLGKICQKAHADLSEQLRTVLRRNLKARESERRLAAITFLALMAVDENRRKNQFLRVPGESGSLPRFTSSMAGDLHERLADEKETPPVRAAAIRALAAIDPAGDKTLPLLQEMLQPKRDPGERRAAAEGLGRVFAGLTDSHMNERRPGQMDRSATGLTAVAATGLRDEDAEVRRLCLDVLRQAVELLVRGSDRAMRGMVQPRFPPQPPRLPGPGLAVQQPPADAPVPVDPRRQMYSALAEEINKHLAAVAESLADKDLDVCLAAYQVLEKTAVARQRRRSTPAEREKAADLAGILKVLPQIREGLRHKNVRVQLAALYVLESLGTESAPVLEAVAVALKDDKNGYVRWGAARVLHNMAPLEAKEARKAVAALRGAVSDPNKTVRLTAVTALGRYGSEAKEAVEALSKTLGDAEPRIRKEALRVLGDLGPDARSAAGAVLKALADSTPEVRAGAARALGRLRPLDDEAKKALSERLEDGDRSVRQAASEALLEK